MRIEQITPEIIQPPTEWHIILSEKEASTFKRLCSFLNSGGIQALKCYWSSFGFQDAQDMLDLTTTIQKNLTVVVSWPLSWPSSRP